MHHVYGQGQEQAAQLRGKDSELGLLVERVTIPVGRPLGHRVAARSALDASWPGSQCERRGRGDQLGAHLGRGSARSALLIHAPPVSQSQLDKLGARLTAADMIDENDLELLQAQ